MITIDVAFDALGQHWRVRGTFEPSRPAITGGPPDNWQPADPAQWDEHEIVVRHPEDGSLSQDMSDLLEHLRVPGRAGSALDYILDLAELQWLRDRDAERWAA